jgi:hypothetical protein
MTSLYPNPLPESGFSTGHLTHSGRVHNSFNDRPLFLGDSDFGVNLTGTADSTAAVQAAVNRAQDGVAIEVPPQAKIRIDGTVDLGSASLSSRRNFRMFSYGGKGRNEGNAPAYAFQPCFFKPNAGTMFKMDSFAAGSNNQWGPIFEGLSFRDTTNTGAGESVTFFDLIMVNRFTFRDCAFLFGLRGVSLDSKEDSFSGGDSAWGLFDNCTWYQCGHGIYSRHTYGHEVRGGHAYRCGAISGNDLAGAWIELDAYSQHWRVHGFKVDGHRSLTPAFVGIRDLGSSNEYSLGHFERCVTGIKLDGDAAVSAPPSGDHRTVSACSFRGGDGSVGDGIEITANCNNTNLLGNNIHVVANKVVDNSPNGATIVDQDNNVKIGQTHATPGTPGNGVVLYVDSSGNLLAKTKLGNVRTVAAV